MPEEYSKEQLWELYQALPEDLKEAVFSEKTAQAIYDICIRNNLEKKLPQVAKYSGYVLLGLLPPDELQKTIQEELKLKNDLLKRVTLEINRFVFSPLKQSLEVLYKTKIEKTEKSINPETKPEEKPKKDIYREPIE